MKKRGRLKFVPIETPPAPGDRIFITVYLDPQAAGLVPRPHTFMVEAHDADRGKAIERMARAIQLTLEGLCRKQN